jgi:putative transposase
MVKMGLSAIYQRPRTSDPHPDHPTYPYLLKDLEITRPNHVWCSDITYIPMRRGFLYLVAIMDWATRKVLSWRLSNTMAADFCIEALEEALDRLRGVSGLPCTCFGCHAFLTEKESNHGDFRQPY